MPRLTRVVLDNFLSFGHLDFDLCGKNGPRGHALVYGENGSGKTNLVQSVRFLHDSVGTIVAADALDAIRAGQSGDGPHGFPDVPEGRDPGTAVNRMTRLGLDKGPVSLLNMGRSCRMAGTEEPMSLTYEFDTDEDRLSYAMIFSEDGALVREELSRFTTGSRTGRLFLVESTGEGPDIRFGRGVFGPELSRSLKRRIPVSWGRNSLLAILMSEFSRNNPAFMESSVSGSVRAAIGFIIRLITDVNAGTRTSLWPDGMPMEQGIIDPVEKPRLDAYGKAASSYLVRLYSDIKGAEYETRERDGRLEYRLVVEKVIAGERRRIPLEQESAGTRKLLRMLPALLGCVRGGVALIDEFDSGVHDRIVHDMLGEVIQSLEGQLVLTTHNTLLLETAEPSNVYVIRTSVDGFKEIRTFDSIARTRKGHHNNRQRYLQGLYDGVPIIRSLDLGSIADRLDRDLGDAV